MVKNRRSPCCIVVPADIRNDESHAVSVATYVILILSSVTYAIVTHVYSLVINFHVLNFRGCVNPRKFLNLRYPVSEILSESIALSGEEKDVNSVSCKVER